MEIINFLKESFHIDIFIVLIVLASGFFQDQYLGAWEIVKDKKTSAAIRTLIVSAIVSAIYLALVVPPKEMLANYFLSYFVATSLYELMIKPFHRFLKSSSDNKP